MIKVFWVDKNGGSHYHLPDCPMVKNIVINVVNSLDDIEAISSHYELVKRKVNKNRLYPAFITVDKKIYIPCFCVQDNAINSRR
jgi:hypothetical protein